MYGIEEPHGDFDPSAIKHKLLNGNKIHVLSG